MKPIQICSSLVSAQKRPRLYWTNIPGACVPEDQGVLLQDVFSGQGEVINDHPVILERSQASLKIKNATAQGFLWAEHGDSVNLEVPNSQTRRGRVGKGKTNTLNTSCDVGVNWFGDLVKVTRHDLERLQTLPRNFTNGISMNQARKAIGNGWTVDVIVHLLSGIKQQLNSN